MRRNGRVALNAIVHTLSGLAPRSGTRIVFGAWLGERYADNPRYLLEHLLEHHAGEFELVWCAAGSVRDEVPPGVSFVERGSARSMLAMLRAAHCFVSHGPRDLGPITPVRGATMTYLGHGVTIKRMGAPAAPRGALVDAYTRLRNRQDRFDFFSASSEAQVHKMVDEFSHFGIEVGKVIESGQPRNDLVLGDGAPSVREVRESCAAVLGIPPDRRVIAYMPTFRDSGEPTFSFASMSPEDTSRLAALLEHHDACIVEKKHPAESGAGTGFVDGGDRRVVSVPPHVSLDTQDLLMASDVLVTDYSGCFIDYLLLDRPIIHFAYDHDRYTGEDRGLYYPLEEIAGGDLVVSTSELWDALERALDDPSHGEARRRLLRDRLLTWEQGVASATIARHVLGTVGAVS